jgi:hypothetical protein
LVDATSYGFIVETDSKYEVTELSPFDELIYLAVLGLQDTVVMDFIPRTGHFALPVFVYPLLMPHPGVFVEAEKFASVACWDGAEELAADFGLKLDQLTFSELLEWA